MFITYASDLAKVQVLVSFCTDAMVSGRCARGKQKYLGHALCSSSINLQFKTYLIQVNKKRPACFFADRFNFFPWVLHGAPPKAVA